MQRRGDVIPRGTCTRRRWHALRAGEGGINAFVRKPVSCAQLMTLADTILPMPKKV